MIRFALLTLTLACLPATAADWDTRPTSRLGFEASAQGESFAGGFTRFEARIRFAPEALAGSRFEVDIDLASVDSQNEERDEMLADPAFFDSAAVPAARYVAEGFVLLDDGRYRAEGTLTLRGVTQAVPLVFSWRQDGGTATLAGEATIDRLAFKVGEGEWADTEVIAREVRVSTTLELEARPAP